MVNLTKRMHRLMPLWSVKSGAGAAILPPKPPAPQLVHLRLQLPNPCNGYDNGARTFWKTFLPSLRYHNLTLPIVVEQKLKPGPSFIPTMTLQFESPSAQDLESINTTPSISDSEALELAKQRLQSRRHQDRMTAVMDADSNDDNTTSPPPPPSPRRNTSSTSTTWVDLLIKEQEDHGVPSEAATLIGPILTKPQPAANPSQPSTTSPPPTTYTRTITLNLRGRTPDQIWSYFKRVTKARQFYRSVEDGQAKRRMDRFFDKAEEDRKRVRTGVDAMRREKEDLRRAREAADRLAADA